jgi:outer membrane protein OmpA-like peptidoglycan-associated protein
VWNHAGELFESKGDSEVLSKAGKARIDAAIGEMGERAIGAAMVVEGYAISEGAGGELGLSRSRATLVRNYVQARFQIDGQNIGAVPLRGLPPPSTHKSSWNGVCIVLLSEAS